MGIAKLCFASYIDNLYTTGTGVSGATASMEMILAHLRDVWGLTTKAGSKHVIACKGCVDVQATGNGWCLDEIAEILGWLVQSDGGTHAAWTALQTKLWRCFYGNVRKRSFKTLSWDNRCKVLSRALLPIFAYAAQIWPPKYGLAMQVDKLQRRMIGTAIGIFRYPSEPFDAFFKRRSRMASRTIESNDAWWTRAWFTRALQWEDHCRRSLVCQQRHFVEGVPFAQLCSKFPWPPLLLDWSGADYLCDRRTFHLRSRSSASLISRTGTRTARGFVHVRWHTGIEYARRFV